MTDIVKELCATKCTREPFTPSHAECQCLVANKAAYEIQRLRELVGDLASLAESAMRDANRDGAEYDIAAELADARAALATANTTANTSDAATDENDATP